MAVKSLETKVKSDTNSTVFVVEYVSPRAMLHRINQYTGARVRADYNVGKRFDIFLELPRMDIHGFDVGTEMCKFSTKVYEREKIGCIYGVPTVVEPFCINPMELIVKHIVLPKKACATYTPSTKDDMLEELDCILRGSAHLMPYATFSKDARTWFIGDYGYSLEENKEV